MPDASCKLLDGKWLAAKMYGRIRAKVESLRGDGARVPGLGVILVGDNPASQAYVANKEKVAQQQCGFEGFNVRLPTHATCDQVKSVIEEFNRNPAVDGILLQLPLPKHLDTHSLLDLIDPAKDVDGLHPYNQGLLFKGEAGLRPCTPLGVMHLIDLAFSKIVPGKGELEVERLPCVDLAGKRAMVIGRSILVGKPLAALLLERNATVTQAHSKSADLRGLCLEADILVAAVGMPQLVKGDWIKPGAVVIDVGINRLASGKLTGDVDFEGAASRASAITPVPGGVGPMTVAMLMLNTLKAYERRMK